MIIAWLLPFKQGGAREQVRKFFDDEAEASDVEDSESADASTGRGSLSDFIVDTDSDEDSEMNLEERRAIARQAYQQPGALLPHMRLRPHDDNKLLRAGPAVLEAPLKTPPDGLCAIYCFLAAQNVQQWQSLHMDDMGFINDRAAEKRYRAEALRIRSAIVAKMREHGEDAMASRIELPGEYPGDEEFRYYSEVFGGAFIVKYLSHAHIPSVVHGTSALASVKLVIFSLCYVFPYIKTKSCASSKPGEGAIIMEIGHVLSRDGTGHGSGHYVLVQSWLPQPDEETSTETTDSETSSSEDASSCGTNLEPAALLPCRLCPDENEGLLFAGPPVLEKPLRMPPGGLGVIYCFLAAQDVQQWQQLDLDGSGYILDDSTGLRYRRRALQTRSDIVARMKGRGDDAMASRIMQPGEHPGDEEFGYYSEVFGGAFIVNSRDRPAVTCGSSAQALLVFLLLYYLLVWQKLAGCLEPSKVMEE